VLYAIIYSGGVEERGGARTTKRERTGVAPVPMMMVF